jgi:hypothetical protein
MLQARHAPPAASGSATPPSPPAVERPSSTSSVTGRGRLVDIVV